MQNINAAVYEYGTFSDAQLISELKKADLIIDALLGYNLKGNPEEPIATFIHLANNSGKPILAIDIPSGLKADTGEPLTPAIKAQTTLTLALPKTGLLTKMEQL